MFSLSKVYNNLKIPEQNGKRIGLFRTLSAIFGGLIVAYLGMTVVVFLIPDTVEISIILPLLFNTLIWSIVALWIVVSPTKLSALNRVIFPTLFFSMLIYFFY